MGKSNSTIRVLSGALKGRVLKMVESEKTRSTKAIVKESFFNTLACEIPNSLFIEAFAGTGSMGIEALSNGAKYAIFMETSKEAHGVLVENIRNLNLTQRSEIFLGDSFELLERLAGRFLKEERLILYLDPPFAIRNGYEVIYERIYALFERLDIPRGILALECMSSAHIPTEIGRFRHFKQRTFGKTALSYFIAS